MDITLEELVSFLKDQGFIFQGSEIYGGLANSWDYGPLGVLLEKNIKDLWFKKFIQESIYNVGLDSCILMNKQVWEASGHLSNFSDPLIDCKECKTRYRADKLIDDFTKGSVNADKFSDKELIDYINEHKIKCPNCGKCNFTDVRKFNLMFKTNQGVIESSKNEIYLRPETAQGIFINFKNVMRSLRKKLPFGIGQIGKSFRNEITPGNFIFRTREFEQMELEFFCEPGTEIKWYNYWRDFCFNFLLDMGIKKENLRIREHDKEELSFYSNATSDIEYKFPFGFGELWGIASRTDYDLKQHMMHSKENLEYLDPNTNTKYIPYVVEPSVGVGRLILVNLFNAYTKEKKDNDERIVLKLDKRLSPYFCTVLPLVKKVHQDKAIELYSILSKYFSVSYDDTQNIGKRYRRADAIGTYLAITVDDTTLSENKVTVRNRDTMKQEVVEVSNLVNYLRNILEN